MANSGDGFDKLLVGPWPYQSLRLCIGASEFVHTPRRPQGDFADTSLGSLRQCAKRACLLLIQITTYTRIIVAVTRLIAPPPPQEGANI